MGPFHSTVPHRPYQTNAVASTSTCRRINNLELPCRGPSTKLPPVALTRQASINLRWDFRVMAPVLASTLHEPSTLSPPSWLNGRAKGSHPSARVTVIDQFLSRVSGTACLANHSHWVGLTDDFRYLDRMPRYRQSSFLQITHLNFRHWSTHCIVPRVCRPVLISCPGILPSPPSYPTPPSF